MWQGDVGADTALGGEGFQPGQEGIRRQVDRTVVDGDAFLATERRVDLRRLRVGNGVSEDGVTVGHGILKLARLMLFHARIWMMRITPPLLVLAASLLSAPVAMALNEYGIEGMGVVSTRADEGRATISADGQRIVFARRGEAGWGLWQARVVDGRWQQAQALPVGVAGEARDPYFSRDGRWLLFAAYREGALALYRAALAADGQLGPAQPLAGDGGHREERGPAERGRQAAAVCPPAGPRRWLGSVRGAAGCERQARPGQRAERIEQRRR